MKAVSVTKALVAVLVVALALPVAANAAYYVYQQGSQSSQHTASVYLNSSHRKIVTMILTGKCDDGSRVDVSATNVKVSSKGSFSGSVDFSFYHYATQANYTAKAEFSGKVKKRKYVKGSVTVTTDAPGCGGLSHSFKAKFKRTQTGG